VRLGDYVTLGNGVLLGNGVRLGNGVQLGDHVRLGNGVHYKTTPLQVQCHPYIVYPYSLKEIGVGCIVHPSAYWDNEPEELAEHPECLPWSNYLEAIEMVKKWQSSQKGE
jgi:hypothetical protein